MQVCWFVTIESLVSVVVVAVQYLYHGLYILLIYLRDVTDGVRERVTVHSDREPKYALAHSKLLELKG